MRQVYGFGQYPTSVVFDKFDLVGGKALPLYGWLTSRLANQWGVNRIVFDYEKRRLAVMSGDVTYLRTYAYECAY